MDQYYILLAVVACYFVYRAFKFVKRKIRWAIATLPMLATWGGTNLPPGKMQHLIALFT